jgi:hypothetical protein
MVINEKTKPPIPPIIIHLVTNADPASTDTAPKNIFHVYIAPTTTNNNSAIDLLIVPFKLITSVYDDAYDCVLNADFDNTGFDDLPIFIICVYLVLKIFIKKYTHTIPIIKYCQNELKSANMSTNLDNYDSAV